ncbi:MAG: ABC-F type ribosomal protection protein [Atopostipes sp.]|nr:ABC-F type ribosomal protection protein [Atopostipes sp.]
MLLQTQNITRRFSGNTLFTDVHFEIKKTSRIGLVGRNGSGKSTLLKILAEIEPPDEGRVMKRKNLTIGFLDQHGGLESERTIWEEMLKVFEDVIKIEKKMRQLEHEMSQISELEDEVSDELLKNYHHLQESFERQSGYSYESEIETILHGFSFFEEDYDKPIKHLSGGQKTRLALAKLLLEKPQLLILDEPTNHLDIETLSWLENYLMNYSGALVIVSHDRYFLDKLTEETYELSHGRMNHYLGNYSYYLEQKAKNLEIQRRDYEKQQKKIAEMEEFVEKNIARASTSRRAQSRRKQLEKIDRIEEPLANEQSAFFSFVPERESGNIVLQAENLAIGYQEDQALSRGIDLDIQKGDAIALIGPNGIGKSTLLKTIIGKISPVKSDIHFGTKVDIGYYDQEQKDLHPSKTILNEVWDDHPLTDEEKIRTFLGSFLFSGEDVKKNIASLSGGERARVSLAKLALNHDNFLILDEPTNHLDIDSKEVLENALIDFQGTLLFVSHDRYFINRMATKVLEIGQDGSTLYLGDYDYYLHKQEEKHEIERAKREEEELKSQKRDQFSSNQKKKKGSWASRKEIKRKSRRLKRKIRKHEEKITKIEDELEAITKEMNKLSTVNTEQTNNSDLTEELTELSHDFDQKNEDLEELFQSWEELSVELNQLEK